MMNNQLLLYSSSIALQGPHAKGGYANFIISALRNIHDDKPANNKVDTHSFLPLMEPTYTVREAPDHKIPSESSLQKPLTLY